MNRGKERRITLGDDEVNLYEMHGMATDGSLDGRLTETAIKARQAWRAVSCTCRKRVSLGTK